MKMLKGFDLSHWNSVKSWDLLAKQADFVILKVGGSDSGVYIDSKFLEFYKKAKEKGIQVGAYWFIGYKSSSKQAVADADFIVKFLKKNKIQLDLPIFLDIETPAYTNAPALHCRSIVSTFCEQIEKYNYFAGFYTFKSFWEKKLKGLEKRFFCWMAYWTRDNKTYIKDKNIRMHQYYVGENLAFTGAVDHDVLFADLAAIIKKKGLNK